MTNNAQSYNLRHQRLWLLPEKAIYWQKKKMLLIADLHIGKSGHFRKNGIPVPGKVNTSNINLVNSLIQKMDVEHLVILGDLFHSNANEEWESFREWRNQYSKLQVTLVIGNHDILPNALYHSSHVNLFKQLTIAPFHFIHDLNTIDEDRHNGNYILSGHIHPAVKLKGKGRQSLKLPCFYFGSDQGILPAFGQFTGTHVIEPNEGDRVFTVVNSEIFSFQT